MTPQPPDGKVFDIVELNGLLVKFRRENATMDDFINIRNFIAASIDKERRRFAIEKLRDAKLEMPYNLGFADRIDRIIAEIKEEGEDGRNKKTWN